MSKKELALKNWQKEKDADVAIITSRHNVFYLSGYDSEPHERLIAFVSFSDGTSFLICPAMEVEDAQKKSDGYDVIGYLDTDDSMEMMMKEIHKRANKTTKIALEKEHLLVYRYEQLLSFFNQAAFISAEEILHQLRMVKDEYEIELISKACEYADFAIDVGVKALREGITEMEVLGEIEYELKKKGIRDMSFSTMVLTGANAASPHGNPGQSKVKKGDLVLFDLGVVYQGYCSDITRTVAFGDITDEQAKIYNTVLTAQKKAVAACRPGVSCADVDKIAREHITDAGYGEYFPHRLGHGMGLSVHEYPSMTGSNPLELQKGMCFTIEPGIYVPNIAGVRIEDDLIVTDQEPLILTKYPKELVIV